MSINKNVLKLIFGLFQFDLLMRNILLHFKTIFETKFIISHSNQ